MKTEGIFEKISGLNMPGLILLAARPGMGKTSFALNMARIVAEKKTAAVFSMEMSREQVSARLLVCAPSTENGRTHAGNIYIDDTPISSCSPDRAGRRTDFHPTAAQRPGTSGRSVNRK